MQTIFIAISKILVTPLVAVLTFAGYNVAPHNEYVQKLNSLQSQVSIVDQKIGNVNSKMQLGATPYSPTGGGTYRLQSSVGTTDTTIKLSSFKEPVSNIPYTMTYLNTAIAYGTLDPQQPTRSEFISFTGITQNSDGTATLTGVTRGMSRSYPYTASTTLRQAHSGQSIFILSDSPQHFSEYAIKRNDETITGQWTFSTFPITPASPAASETTAGIVELATGAEAAASTLSGTLGRLSLPTAISTSTYNAATAVNVIPVTGGTGKIDSNFISTTTLGLPIYFDFGDGSDGDVTISSPATSTRDMYYNNLVVNSTLATGNYRIFVKGTLSGNGTITSLGNPASGATAGATTTGYFVTPGGATGGTAVSDADGIAGSNSPVFSISFSTLKSGNGGAGGTAGRTAGTGGIAGNNYGTTTSIVRSFSKIMALNDINATTSELFRLSSGAAGAGGGSGATAIGSGTSGAGGGGGASGGILYVAAKTHSSTITYKATGGNGGNGNGASITNAGGGGGGGGGKGGVVILVYKDGSGLGTCTVTGGSAGAGGAGAGSGTAGTAGSSGADGICLSVDVDNLIAN